MRLIERFAVVRISAASDFIAASEFHFDKPIRIGKRLAREPGDVCVALFQNRLRLLESTDTAGGYNRRFESRLIDRTLDGSHQRNAAAERSCLIGKNRRHTLVAALAGVGIDRLSDFGLLRIFKLSAF